MKNKKKGQKLNNSFSIINIRLEIDMLIIIIKKEVEKVKLNYINQKSMFYIGKFEILCITDGNSTGK